MSAPDQIEQPTQDLPHQESVWDYPRPPLLEPTPRRLRILHAGSIIAETTDALRILETSHPPVYYFPPSDVAMHLLHPSNRGRSFCEFKGLASYWDLVVPQRPVIRNVAWSYPSPSKNYAALKDHLAFYASHVEECWVGGERVIPQPGDFYGGWITSHVKGPFKGPPGTLGW